MESLDLERVPFPTFEDLQENAESTKLRRAFARYLIPKNYEKSIRRHRRLGSHLVSKFIADKIGKSRKEPHYDHNYFLNRSRNRLEASVDYALKGSVFNEVVHTATSVVAGPMFLFCVLESGGAAQKIIGISGAVLELVNIESAVIQRHNRALMVRRANEELAEGETFSAGYINSFGIDSRAYDNYYANQPSPGVDLKSINS